MKKMTRRDYLLRMGSGAAGLIAASGLDVFGHKSNTTSNSTPTQPPSPNLQALNWQVTNTLPSPTAFVTGFFVGLIGFCYDNRNSSNRFVDVGFHRGGGRHQFEIVIYRNPGCHIVKRYRPRIRSLQFGVSPNGTGPNVFQTPGPFDRNRTGGSYEHDFRWLPDLDSADFYPRNHPKNTGHYRTRLKVTDGTFYTRMRTKSTFKLVDADPHNCNQEIRDFGHVALYMAVAIDTRSTVHLTGADPLVWAQGVSYQVVFRNECHRCNYEVDDCDERRRNDFHFNRKVLRLPGNERKYALRLKQGCSGSECREPDFCFPPPDRHGLTDEAPCMGSAFGQTVGLP